MARFFSFRGRGLGPDFAIALHRIFNTTFKDFGEEKIPDSPHFEKLTLFDSGVGKDNVSDFTTNLIKKYLLDYTQEFTLAKKRKSKKFIRFLKPLEPSEADRKLARLSAIHRFPQIIDYYLAVKEDHGEEASQLSRDNVAQINTQFVSQVQNLVALLERRTNFYSEPTDSYEAALKRAQYFKDVIEKNDGWRIFYVNGNPITREKDVHILYRLTWFASAFDVNSESNSGRGPVDFAISKGSANKALVEFKLASNSSLAQNLEHQTAIYQKSHRTSKSVKVVIYYSEAELAKVESVLRHLGLENDQSVVLVDARSDNKQSASKVKTPKTN